MRKLIATLYKGSLALIYYIEIGEDKSSFIFSPSLYNREYPHFTLHWTNGEFKESGKVDAHLLAQAKEEIKSLLSINLVENVNKHIANSFLYP